MCVQHVLEFYYKLQVRTCRQPSWHNRNIYLYTIYHMSAIMLHFCTCYFIQTNMHLTDGLQRDEETCLRSQTQKSAKPALEVRSLQIQSTTMFLPLYFTAPLKHTFQQATICQRCSHVILLTEQTSISFLLVTHFCRRKKRNAERRNASSKVISLLKSKIDLDTDLSDSKQWSFKLPLALC